MKQKTGLSKGGIRLIMARLAIIMDHKLGIIRRIMSMPLGERRRLNETSSGKEREWGLMV